MKLSIAYILTLGFIGFIFNKCSYNLKNSTLEQLYHDSNLDFITSNKDITSNKNYHLNRSKHKLNLATFLNQSDFKKDSFFLSSQDSLLASISTNNNLLRSKLINEQTYIHFIKNFKTQLIQKVKNPRQQEIDFLDDQILELQEALRKNSMNSIARHNLEVITKLKQHADFYYNKAHDISELIYTQLENDLKTDSSTFIDYSTEAYQKNYADKINEIKTDYKKALCKKEVADSLSSLLNTELLNASNSETIDSIKLYDNIDLKLIDKLKSKKSTQNIINEFYNQDYPELYGNSSQEVFKRIVTHEETNQTIQKVISKYLDPDQKEENKNEDSKDEEKKDKDSKEQKDKNQKDNSDKKDKNKKQDGNDKQNNQGQKKGDESSNNDQNGKSDSEKLKDEQKKKSQSQNDQKKKNEMKDALSDLDKKKQQEKKSNYNQQPDEQKANGQKSKAKESEKSEKDSQKATDETQQRLKEHNMTQKSAEQTLKSLEQKADRYLQNQKRAEQRDLEYGTKPDW